MIWGGTFTSIYNNQGYNPFGNVKTPIYVGTGNNYLLDGLRSGSSSTWASATTFTNWESTKVLNISGGKVSSVVKNGVTIFSNTNCNVTLQLGDTFSGTFTLAPTINVAGQ